MKDTEFKQLIKFKVVNGVLYPSENNGVEYALQNENAEVYLLPKTPRDLAFHGCYFLFVGWLWDQMPRSFKLHRCHDKTEMYNYLKIVQGKYKVKMKYKGIEFHEIESINFGKMTNDSFIAFVEEQIHCLYSEILVPLGLEHLHEQAEKEFKGLFKKLI